MKNGMEIAAILGVVDVLAGADGRDVIKEGVWDLLNPLGGACVVGGGIRTG